MIRRTRRAEKERDKGWGERERNATSASLELERECIVTQLNVANSRFPQKQGRLPHRLSPPRTGSVWGDNWRVPWHAEKEWAPRSATQTLAHVSVYLKTTDWRRTCACLFACATVCAFARVYQRRRVIILFFLRRNPFLLSLREHRGLMRDEPERAWRQFWGRPVLFVFLFIPLSWCHSLLPLLHLFLWNFSCVALTTAVCELPLLLSFLRLWGGCARSNMTDSMASFLSFPFSQTFFFVCVPAC